VVQDLCVFERCHAVQQQHPAMANQECGWKKQGQEDAAKGDPVAATPLLCQLFVTRAAAALHLNRHQCRTSLAALVAQVSYAWCVAYSFQQSSLVLCCCCCCLLQVEVQCCVLAHLQG
jgi:hypothetical protein